MASPWTLASPFALIALCLGACAEVGPPCEPPDPAPVIGVDDAGRFLADGVPVVPRLVNSYPLLDHAGWERWGAITEILRTARELGRPLVRTGAYMIGGTNPARLRDEDGALREEGLVALDRVLAMAADEGVQLLLITANHWPDYGGAPAVPANFVSLLSANYTAIVATSPPMENNTYMEGGGIFKRDGRWYVTFGVGCCFCPFGGTFRLSTLKQ